MLVSYPVNPYHMVIVVPRKIDTGTLGLVYIFPALYGSLLRSSKGLLSFTTFFKFMLDIFYTTIIGEPVFSCASTQIYSKNLIYL